MFKSKLSKSFLGVVLDQIGRLNLEIDDDTVKQTIIEVAKNASKTQIDPSLTNIILEQIDGIDGKEKKEVVIRALLAFT